MAPRNPSLTRQNGAAIRSFRERAGMRGVQLAKAVECTPRHLTNIEKERYGASPALLNRIANALSIPVAALLRVQPGDEDAA